MRVTPHRSSVRVALDGDVAVTRFPPNKRCGAEWLIETTLPWTALPGHCHVATLFVAKRLDRDVVLRSEPVSQVSLDHLLENGPLPPSAFKQVVYELGAALCHAHSQQLIHGSLHPAAIAFGSKGALYPHP